jgi:FKBP-type peptidyl-prolyl cis-trans isomerase 2
MNFFGLKGRLMTQDLAPGMLVRHPQRPDWGIGQVQSAIGHRVTVNFEHAGKVLINSEKVTLTPVEESDS